MLARTVMLAVALALAASTAASARSYHHYRHHHGWLSGRNVSLHHQSGAPASVSPRGGDRAPITGGGY